MGTPGSLRVTRQSSRNWTQTGCKGRRLLEWVCNSDSSGALGLGQCGYREELHLWDIHLYSGFAAGALGEGHTPYHGGRMLSIWRETAARFGPGLCDHRSTSKVV